MLQHLQPPAAGIVLARSAGLTHVVEHWPRVLRASFRQCPRLISQPPHPGRDLLGLDLALLTNLLLRAIDHLLSCALRR